MSEAHWLFLVLSGIAIAVAGIIAVVREIRQEGFLWGTWALRAFFLLVTAGLGFALPTIAPVLKDAPLGLDPLNSMIAAIILFVLVFSAEVFAGAVNISVVVFGAMIGIIVAHLAYFLLLLVMEPMARTEADRQIMSQYAIASKVLLSIVFAYLFVLMIYKNRDRFNFIIPYVEFRRERRGGSAVVVDTSAIIDGRLADLCETRVIEGPLIVPRFVLRELQTLADSADKLKRSRGRRGLDMLNRLRKGSVLVQIDEGRVPGASDVDAMLVKLAETLGARLITTDVNLSKIAIVQGVHVINLNDIATAMKPLALPGEPLSIELLRSGETPDQAVGYLDDGTMVVVENAQHRIGSTVEVIVTRLLQTPTGRIIFSKLRSDEAGPHDRSNNNAHRRR